MKNCQFKNYSLYRSLMLNRFALNRFALGMSLFSMFSSFSAFATTQALHSEWIVRFHSPQNSVAQTEKLLQDIYKENYSKVLSNDDGILNHSPIRSQLLSKQFVKSVIQKTSVLNSAQGVVKIKTSEPYLLQSLLSQSAEVLSVHQNNWYRPLIHYSLPSENNEIPLLESGYRPFLLFPNALDFAGLPPVLLPPAQQVSGVDSLLAKDWAMKEINVENLYSYNDLPKLKEVTVAVIDTGVDYNHEDLIAGMWRNPSDPLEVGFDFAHNHKKPYDNMHFDFDGCMKDPGCRLGIGSENYLVNPGHGTHCAGHVAAVANNSIGIRGVGAGAKMMALKFFYDHGEENAGGGDDAAAIQSIDYAVNNGAKIISASWGGRGDRYSDQNSELRQSILRARDAGVLFIVASGNDGINQDEVDDPVFPAAFEGLDNMIVVGAMDVNDKIAGFSNYGARSVHLGAPGVKILSTTVGSKYSDTVVKYKDARGKERSMDWDGTSMATPIVAGAAALIWAAHPNETYLQIRNRILNSVRKVPGLESKFITAGVLDVEAAIR